MFGKTWARLFLPLQMNRVAWEMKRRGVVDGQPIFLENS